MSHAVLSRFAALALTAALFLTSAEAVWADGGKAIAALRKDALAAVNDRRGKERLAPLAADATLDAIARKHAEDMIARRYFGHASPEGDTAEERFRKAGGSRWELVAENVAECRNCGSRPLAGLAQRFQSDWMDSPAHRTNILRDGIERFGFGIVASGDGRVVAVQMFAGAGRPHGLAAGQAEAETPASERARAALDAVNRARRAGGRKPLKASGTLDRIAAGMLPERAELAAGGIPGPMRWPSAADSIRWRSLDSLRAYCGGCGRLATTADARFFLDLWLEDPGYRDRLLEPAATHLGFALRAGGDGRKAAVLVVGRTS